MSLALRITSHTNSDITRMAILGPTIAVAPCRHLSIPRTLCALLPVRDGRGTALYLHGCGYGSMTPIVVRKTLSIASRQRHSALAVVPKRIAMRLQGFALA